MGIRDQVTKKLSQATCDKIEWNKRFLRVHKSWKEVEKVIGRKKKEDGTKKK